MKNLAFVNEDEWRIIHFSGFASVGLLGAALLQPEYRVSDGRIRPFVILKCPEGQPFAYKKVILGYSFPEQIDSLKVMMWNLGKMLVQNFERSPVRVRP